MPRTGLWLQVFVALLLAALPPILVLALGLLFSEGFLRAAGPDVVAVGIVLAAVAWAALLTIVYTRTLAGEFRALLDIARTGGGSEESGARSADAQLAASLEQRNRQMAALANQSASIPIDDDPPLVARAVVDAVQTVMQDPTWRAVVHEAADPSVLPPGVYHASRDEDAHDRIGELEQWASVTGTGEAVVHAEGPWGAFVIVRLGASDRLRAILLAPWEGRLPPTAAERNVLALVGQHAGSALDHSLLYARVRAQADELNRMASVQADFLRGVTHDLQTPLTSIGALATELRADPSIHPAARADLDSISHQADRLRRMVGQLLVASRLEAGVVTPGQEVFAVEPVIEGTWSALRAGRPFELVVDGPAHLAVADPNRLEQVLWAVLDNAVKYSPDGSPITARITPRDGMLGISVTDAGTGMDDETRRRAFEQFYRSADARRLAPDGSGVGLYAASGLMKAMGGSIDVESRLGGGTTVTVNVPAEPVETGE